MDLNGVIPHMGYAIGTMTASGLIHRSLSFLFAAHFSDQAQQRHSGTEALFSSLELLKNLQDSLSHRIFDVCIEY
jgi:hypothetical protein